MRKVLFFVFLLGCLQVILSSSATCPPLKSNAVDFTCRLAGQGNDCSQPQQVGSIAKFTCKPGFAVNNINYTKIFCLSSGEWDETWDAQDAICTTDCGRRNTNDVEPLISLRDSTPVVELPWHVAVYEQDREGSNYFICSGLLISTKVVISAALCFWNHAHDTLKNSSYYIAAGNTRKSWGEGQNNDKVQQREVQSIKVHPQYHGRINSFIGDIALLKLKLQVDISPSVSLICVDWGSRWESSQLQPGNNGTVAGWGLTEEGELRDDLRQLELPYVDFETCYDALNPVTKSLLTPDKFCAGYVNRSIGLCRGDGGGGLVFLHEDTHRYYLQGIASINFAPFDNDDKCYVQSYTAFTYVAHFLQWIKKNVD